MRRMSWKEAVGPRELSNIGPTVIKGTLWHDHVLVLKKVREYVVNLCCTALVKYYFEPRLIYTLVGSPK